MVIIFVVAARTAGKVGKVASFVCSWSCVQPRKPCTNILPHENYPLYGTCMQHYTTKISLTTHREPPVNLFLRLSVCHPLRDEQTPEPASVQGQVDTPPFMGVAKRDTGQLVTAEVHIYPRLVGGEGLEHRRSVRSICVCGGVVYN